MTSESAKVKPPPTIFKYTSIKYALINLGSNAIFFNTPKKFNDTLDCAKIPLIIPPTQEDVEAYRLRLLEKSDLQIEDRIRLKSLSPAAMLAMLTRAATAVLEVQIAATQGTLGVVCFTEHEDDPRMWKEYATQENGVRLEFSTNCDPFNLEHKFHKVVYDSSPTIKVADLMQHRAAIAIQSLFWTKTEKWSHENEWRAMHSSAGTAYRYVSAALVSVVIGGGVSTRARQKIIEILARRYHLGRLVSQQAVPPRIHMALKPKLEAEDLTDPSCL